MSISHNIANLAQFPTYDEHMTPGIDARAAILASLAQRDSGFAVCLSYGIDYKMIRGKVRLETNGTMAIGMRNRRTPGWATLVLGMLLLRALVPAGFMLAPVDGTLAFVLCEPEVISGGHHHHPGPDQAAHQHGTHADPSCPYAQSAGPAPLPTLPILAGVAVPDLWIPPATVTQTVLAFGPPRQQSPRGPPHFA
jgi:hypothetical protein